MFPNLTLPEFPLSLPMGGMDIAFYAVALVMILTAVFTVAVKNILQSAVFLIFSFVATAILYLLLHAEFIALAQVMVYVGGVVIFVVFTILLTSHLGEDAFTTKIPRIFAAFALSIEQPERKCHPSLHRWPEELAVQRYAYRRSCQRQDLHNG